jgi:hypothetical protein
MGATTTPFEPGDRVVVVDNMSIVCGYDGTVLGEMTIPFDDRMVAVEINSDYYHGTFHFRPHEIERVYSCDS